MVDDSLRRRLEALNRGPLAAAAVGSGEAVGERIASAAGRPMADAAAGNGLRLASAPAGPRAEAGSRGAAAVPGLMRRGDVVENSAGQHLRVRLRLEEFWPGGQCLVGARQQHLKELLAAASCAVEPAAVLDGELAAFVAALPDRALLLDLETCGLAGSALFLVGLLRQIGGVPAIELLLARDYAEEAAVLESLWQLVAGHDVLLTFNGKSFDWPMVRERTIRYRLQTGGEDRRVQHLDLLHHARRRWRGRLPDCRLQTLERLVCRRHRTADVPGHRIPAVYAEFVRTGFARDMDIVLQHNALDLVTMFDLALRLAA